MEPQLCSEDVGIKMFVISWVLHLNTLIVRHSDSFHACGGKEVSSGLSVGQLEYLRDVVIEDFGRYKNYEYSKIVYENMLKTIDAVLVKNRPDCNEFLYKLDTNDRDINDQKQFFEMYRAELYIVNFSKAAHSLL